MPVTPNRFAPSSPRASPGALDALAAVACTTPHSSVVKAGAAAPPITPVSAACAAVSWLHCLVEARLETGAKPGEVLAEGLVGIVSDRPLWNRMVSQMHLLSDRVATEVMDKGCEEQRSRDAMAVYYAAVEAILVREACRLKGQKSRFADKLVNNLVFHKSILTCAWEVAAAVYGRRDTVVFCTAMKVFDLSPFSLTKAVESFVIRLPNIPRAISKHILTCDARILESMVWHPRSQLVCTLRERSRVLAAPDEGDREESVEKSNVKKEGSEDVKNDTIEKSDIVGCTKLPANATNATKEGTVKEFALELFYKKMLSIASDRVQELLLLLRMEAIAEPVWACIKYSVWEKWPLMVNRHLDQIIMCCVYGVAKVRRYQLKFKEIISTYRNMSHVREASFSHLIPNIFRDMCIESHDDAQTPVCARTACAEVKEKESRGDIIKFYNQVFIHSMKTQLLTYQSGNTRAGAVSVGNKMPKGTPSVKCAALSSSCSTYPVSGTSSQMSGGACKDDRRGRIGKDRLDATVMNSPMRVLRPHASPRRIGRVTVSPMSPGGRMTPGTRTLYAFGESPVRSLDRINRTLSSDRRARRPVPLSFDKGDLQRSASIRKRYADVLGRTARLASTGEHKSSDVGRGDGVVGEDKSKVF